MLGKLHEDIESILPINGVIDSDGNIEVDYIDPPTSEQLSQIDALIAAWPLERAKLDKLELVDEEWRTVLENGWETPYGFCLGVDVPDIALLNGNFVLAKEAANMGITDPTFVVDKDGVSHSFNLTDLTALMLQYGQARAALSAEDSAKRTAISNATTIEELNNL